MSCVTQILMCVFSVHMTTASDRWTRLWSRRTSRSRFHTDATAESVSESYRSVCHRSRICVCFSSLTLLCCSSSLGSRREALHRCWRYVARQSHDNVIFAVISHHVSCLYSWRGGWRLPGNLGVVLFNFSKEPFEGESMRLQIKALQSEHGIKYCMHYCNNASFFSTV